MDMTPSGARFNRRIVIKSPPSAVDATGFTAATPDASTFSTWTTIATCYAGIEPATGNEMRESDREIDKSPVLIYIRYGVGKNIRPTMWAQNQVSGELYDIRDVSHLMDGRRLTQLFCRVVT